MSFFSLLHTFKLRSQTGTQKISLNIHFGNFISNYNVFLSFKKQLFLLINWLLHLHNPQIHAKKSKCQISRHFSNTYSLRDANTCKLLYLMEPDQVLITVTRFPASVLHAKQNVSSPLRTTRFFISILQRCVFDIIHWIKIKVVTHFDWKHETSKHQTLSTEIMFHITTAVFYEWWQSRNCPGGFHVFFFFPIKQNWELSFVFYHRVVI